MERDPLLDAALDLLTKDKKDAAVALFILIGEKLLINNGVIKVDFITRTPESELLEHQVAITHVPPRQI